MLGQDIDELEEFIKKLPPTNRYFVESMLQDKKIIQTIVDIIVEPEGDDSEKLLEISQLLIQSYPERK